MVYFLEDVIVNLEEDRVIYIFEGEYMEVFEDVIEDMVRDGFVLIREGKFWD